AARIERKARLNYGVAETGEPVDHRQVIEKAMAEGKPVPATVLATYPDLKPAAVDAEKPAEMPKVENEGNIDGKNKWSIAPYRYAKNSVVLRTDSNDIFKTRIVRVAEALGGRYVGRAKGYVMTEKRAREAVRLTEEGWDANAISNRLIAPKSREEDVNLSFIQVPDGGLEFGEITNAIGKHIRRQAGKIMLREGNAAWGRKHIDERHGRDMLALGYAGVPDFVADIGSNFDAIYQGEGSTLILVKMDKPHGKMNVILELEKHSDGDIEFYDVKNATPIRADQFKNKSPIWTKEKPLVGFVGPNETSADADSLIPKDSSGNVSVANQPAEGKPAAVNAKKEAKSTTEPKRKIEDAGETLVWNKKNPWLRNGVTWDAIKAQNETLRAALVKKEKVWPRPKWEDFLSDLPENMQKSVTLAARTIKDVYDALPTAPSDKSDAGLQAYIDAVSKVRDASEAFLKDEKAVVDFLAAVVDSNKSRMAGMQGQQINIASLFKDEYRNASRPVFSAIFPKTHAANRIQDAERPLMRIIGNKAVAAMQVDTDQIIKAMKDIENGWPASREAWERQGYQIIGGDGISVDYTASTRYRTNEPYVSILFSSGKRRIANHIVDGATSQDDPGVQSFVKEFIGKTAGKSLLLDKRNDIVSIHDTADSAKEAAREATRRTGGNGPKETGTTVDEAVREGVERRTGDVTEDQTKEAFGFRGVNFGKYVKQDQRQAHLNAAYDALYDLADTLGVPPRALGLNGMLGLAIGAQGSGMALAHFVPGQNEINITRDKGAGSLAHEWGHALDHYFATQAGLARDGDPFLSEHAERSSTIQRYAMEDGRRVVKTEPRFSDGIRPEIVAAFAEISRSMNKIEVSREEHAANQSAYVEIVQADLNRIVNRLGLTEKAASAGVSDMLAKIRNGDIGKYVVFDEKSRKRQKPAGGENIKALGDVTGLSVADMLALHDAAVSLRYAKDQKAASNTHLPQKTTDYRRASRTADKEKGGKQYWATNLEMFARAFESFVFDRVKTGGARNDYLVRAGKDVGELYPQGVEREAINAAFKTLVDAIETKETDKGVALYSKASNKSWYYSQLAKAIEQSPDRVFTTGTQVKLWLAG
ncbi:MAG: hypothetical protein JNK92_14120, partial [Dechloromonas sp.]|nr:hypothetical protein [Dechloromonas sp.]